MKERGTSKTRLSSKDRVAKQCIAIERCLYECGLPGETKAREVDAGTGERCSTAVDRGQNRGAPLLSRKHVGKQSDIVCRHVGVVKIDRLVVLKPVCNGF